MCKSIVPSLRGSAPRALVVRSWIKKYGCGRSAALKVTSWLISHSQIRTQPRIVKVSEVRRDNSQLRCTSLHYHIHEGRAQPSDGPEHLPSLARSFTFDIRRRYTLHIGNVIHSSTSTNHAIPFTTYDISREWTPFNLIKGEERDFVSWLAEFLYTV